MRGNNDVDARRNERYFLGMSLLSLNERIDRGYYLQEKCEVGRDTQKPPPLVKAS
jgi:hypothetical protein